nr:wiskott-Aldrich syndrome protein homolog 1-like [Penaeus vannamei]
MYVGSLNLPRRSASRSPHKSVELRGRPGQGDGFPKVLPGCLSRSRAPPPLLAAPRRPRAPRRSSPLPPLLAAPPPLPRSAAASRSRRSTPLHAAPAAPPLHAPRRSSPPRSRLLAAPRRSSPLPPLLALAAPGSSPLPAAPRRSTAPAAPRRSTPLHAARRSSPRFVAVGGPRGRPARGFPVSESSGRVSGGPRSERYPDEEQRKRSGPEQVIH